MKAAYRILKSLWARTPEPLRRLVRSCPGLNGTKIALASLTARRAAHDDVYSAAYYQEIDGASTASARVIAGSLVREFAPRSVVDVGCGTGALLEALRAQGLPAARGLEKSAHALARCRAAGLEVAAFDLTAPGAGSAGPPADLAVSLEVAEHLPPSCAGSFVALLCSLAPRVVITAAPPGQPGTHHVNEQPPAYWIELFEARGMRHDPEATVRLQSAWRTGGAIDYYWRNLLVFSRTGTDR